MRPALKTTLASRKVGEHAARLLAWIGRNEAVLQLHGAGLRDEVEGLILDLSLLGQTVDTPPCVGVAGLPGARHAALVAALVGRPGHAKGGGVGAVDVNEALSAAMLSPGKGERSCVVVRHSSIVGSAASRDFPIACSLLSELDLVKILARTYLSHVPISHRPLPDAAEVAELFQDVARRLSPEAIPGLSQRDIVDLREHLHGHHPNSRILGALAATGYWDGLAEMAAHLARVDRLRLLALLWRETAVFTSLFERLSASLERLGPGNEICCALDAMLVQPPQGGVLVRHPRSVAATGTLLDVGLPGDERIRVVNRYGGETDIGRAELAALIAEVPLAWGPTRHSPLEPTQILQFPDTHTLSQLPLALYVGRTKGQVTLPVLAQFFADVKSRYLIERSCRRGEITSLVVCVDPGTPDDDMLTPQIGDWIELAQGADAPQRERTKTGLFVVEMPADAGEAGEPAVKAATPGDWDERLGAVIAAGLGAGQDWPREWTPGRPFDNVYKYQRIEAAAQTVNEITAEAALSLSPRVAARLPADRGNVLAMPALFRRAEAARVSRSARAAGVSPEMTGFIHDALLPVSGSASKDRQFDTQLSELRRRLKGRVRRHHLSNDPAQTAEWRRQVANVVQSRLQRCAQNGRLGHLLKALTVGEDELTIYFQRLASTTAAFATATGSLAQGPTVSLLPGDGRGLMVMPDGGAAQAESHAAAAITFWFRTLRQKGRSWRLCRHLNVPQAVFQHIVDELSIGAMRADLAGKLADAFLAGRTAGAGSGDALRLATYAARIIGGFVETFGLTPHRNAASASGGLVAAGAAGGTAPVPMTREPGQPLSGKSFADNWCTAFSSLVEANIAAAPMLAGAADRDRELGEILAFLASTPAEVEL